MQNNSRELTYKMRTEIFASKKTLLLDWFVDIWQDRESQKERKEKFTQLLKTYYFLQQTEDINLQNNYMDSFQFKA